MFRYLKFDLRLYSILFTCELTTETDSHICIAYRHIKAKIPYLYKSEKITYEQFSGFSEDAQTLQSDPSTMFIQHSIC